MSQKWVVRCLPSAVGIVLVLSAAWVARAVSKRAALAAHNGEPVSQPMRFNHQAHRAAEIECVYCHAGATTLEGAGIPAIQECVDCHAGIDNTGKEAMKIDSWIERGEEPPWSAVFVLGKWNRFSHRAHARREIGCDICHGDIGASVEPPLTRHRYEMQWCMDCHSEQQASNDCLACHK